MDSLPLKTGCTFVLLFLEDGISQYGGKTELLGPPLKKCLDKALTSVPSDLISSTPIFMKATAGMRKLK